MPDKLCRSVEDAKKVAAENVLAHLPVSVELSHNGPCSVLINSLLVVMIVIVVVVMVVVRARR